MRFILLFVGAVGLRSAELLSATLGDLRMETEAWVMQVRGKGVKDRIAAVPGQAPPAAPLLASAVDPMAPVGYQALYEHVKGWLRHSFGTRAIARQVPLDVIQAQRGMRLSRPPRPFMAGRRYGGGWTNWGKHFVKRLPEKTARKHSTVSLSAEQL